MTISGSCDQFWWCTWQIINHYRACLGTVVLPTDLHVLWAYFLAVIERFINCEIWIVCWLQATLWQPNMNEIYSNLPISRKDVLHLKCRENHYRPKYVLFSPVKIPFFSNRRALWIKLNKFTIKNLTCNDVTTVCICYVLLILHLYFLSCHYSAWTKANCLAFFTFAWSNGQEKKEHCYHSYFCFL